MTSLLVVCFIFFTIVSGPALIGSLTFNTVGFNYICSIPVVENGMVGTITVVDGCTNGVYDCLVYDGDAVLDECGVCDGSGIAEGACDCDGTLPQENFDCAGNCS